MTDPAAIVLIQDAANRVLNEIVSIRMVNDSEFVGLAPVCPGNILENFARGASGQGGSRQRAFIDAKMRRVHPVQGERELSISGNCQETSVVNFEWLGKKGIADRGKNLQRLLVPRSTIHD